MKRKKIIAIFTSTLMFFLTISNIQPVKAATATFSQGSQYQSGAYDSGAVQPTTYNWTRQSKYTGPENGTAKWYKWHYLTGGRIGTSSPAIGSDGTIYIGSWDNKLYAIDSNGNEEWSRPTGGIIDSSPVIGSDGTIYVGSEDNKLYAFKPDGTLKWTYDTTNSWGSIKSSPSIGSDGTIYVSSTDGNLYAINPNGTKKWAYTTNGYQIASSPAIGSDGTIYIGSYDKKLHAINPLDGTEKWAYTTGDEIFLSSPAIGSDGTIYIGSYDGNLHAVNPDGSEKWSCSIGARTDSSPAIGSDGTIYIGSYDCNLYAIKPDGTEKWAYTTGGRINSTPTIDSNGTIYVGSEDNSLYAINPDGTKNWSYATYWTIDSSPAIGSDGTIYIGSYDSYLYAITTAVFASTTDSSTSNDISTLGLTGTSASSDNAGIATAAVNTTTGEIDITSVAVGTATITITDASGHTATIPVTVNPNGSIAIGDIDKYEVTVTSVAALPDINVADGTTLGDLRLQLPSNVDVTLSDSTTTSATITWYRNSTPSYNGNTPGTYTFTGSLSLPQGVTIPYNKKATVNVVVGAPATVPNAPTNVTAAAGDGSVSLAWTAPDDGGSPITDYLVNVYSNNTLLNTVDTHSTTPSTTIADLTNGTPYTFYVNAVNSVGISTTSSPITVVTPTAPTSPAVVPDAPTGVSATAGNGSVSLTWTAPVNDGGSPITDYLVNVYSNNALLNTVDTHSTTTSATIADLTNGTPYTFDVNAVNSVGIGTTSSATTVVTPTAPTSPAAVPDAPTGVSATAGNGSASLTWTAPANNGGSPITDYLVNVYSNGNAVKTVDTGSTTTSTTIADLTNGTPYTFDVNAVNSVGISTTSSATSVVVPTAPHESSGSSGGGSSNNSSSSGSISIIPVDASTSTNTTGSTSTSSNINPSVLIKNESVPDGSNVEVTVSLGGTKIADDSVTYDAANGVEFELTADEYAQLPDGTSTLTVDASAAGISGTSTITVTKSNDIVPILRPITLDKTAVTSVKSGMSTFNIADLALGNRKDFNNIIIASKSTYADSLSGAMLSARLSAPILMVDDSDATALKDYLNSKLAKGGKVYVLGGTGAVSKQLEDVANEVGTVKRLAGADRYGTNKAILDTMQLKKNSEVIIASGNNFPDAVSASSVSGKSNIPVLLAGSDGLSAELLAKLKSIVPSKITIVGGAGAVSSTVEAQLKSIGVTVNRVAGSDREQTSIDVANSYNTKKNAAAAVLIGTNDFVTGMSLAPITSMTNSNIIVNMSNDIDTIKSAVKADTIVNLTK